MDDMLESDTAEGALQARADARNAVHALFLDVFQAAAAVFMDLLKSDHAALTAVLTAPVVVAVYACWRAAALVV